MIFSNAIAARFGGAIDPGSTTTFMTTDASSARPVQRQLSMSIDPMMDLPPVVATSGRQSTPVRKPSACSTISAGTSKLAVVFAISICAAVGAPFPSAATFPGVRVPELFNASRGRLMSAVNASFVSSRLKEPFTVPGPTSAALPSPASIIVASVSPCEIATSNVD